jgi:hypothetical protein
MQMVYVNKGGDDGTGDGTEAKPYLTISAAMASIGDAATGKRYSILVGPGDYSNAVALKPWVWVQAEGASQNVRISGALTMDAGWGVAGALRGGLKGISFTTAQGFDLSAVSAPNPLVSIDSCVFEDALALTGNGLGTNNSGFDCYGCTFFGQVTQDAGRVRHFDCVAWGGLVINGSVVAGHTNTTRAEVYDGYSSGVNVVSDFSGSGQDAQVLLLGMGSDGNLTVNGDGGFLTITSEAFSTVTATGGASYDNQVALLTKTRSIGYVDDYSYFIAPAPQNVRDAINRAFALLNTLNGGQIP